MVPPPFQICWLKARDFPNQPSEDPSAHPRGLGFHGRRLEARTRCALFPHEKVSSGFRDLQERAFPGLGLGVAGLLLRAACGL